MKPSLKSDTLLYGGAVLVERVLGLALLPLLTRRLSPAEYGLWAQSTVLSSMALPVVLLCLPTAVVRFFAAGVGAAERRRWMRRIVAAFAVVFGFLGLAAWSARDALARSVYGSDALGGFIAPLLALVAADALFDLLIAFLRAAFRTRRIAVLMLTRGATRFAAFGLALAVFDAGFGAAFTGFVLLQLAVVGIAFGLELRGGGEVGAAPVEPAIGWATLLGFSLPLVLLAGLGAVNAYADRFVLTQSLGLETVAVYAAAASLLSVTSVAYTVLGFTLFPVLAKLWAEGEAARVTALATGAMRVFLFLALPFVLWFACVAGTALPMVTTQAYQLPGAVVLLMGLASIGFGLYQIFLYLLLLAGWGLRTVGLMLVVAALNLGLNLVLVPRFGVAGAAAAAAVSNGVLAALAYTVARLRAHARFPWANAARIGGCSLLGAGVLALAQLWGRPLAAPGLVLSLVAAALVYLAADLLPGASVVRAFAGRRFAA